MTAPTESPIQVARRELQAAREELRRASIGHDEDRWAKAEHAYFAALRAYKLAREAKS